MANQNKSKSLSEVFKELERDKNKQVHIYKTNQKEKQEASFMFHVKHRTKRDNLLLILFILIVLFTFSLFSRNYIFAVNLDDENKKVVGTFEKNNNPKDVYSILSTNISVTEQKEIFDQEENIEFETEYIYNKNKPDGETTVIQEGKTGLKNVTYVRSFENNNILEEKSIGESIIENSQTQIIEVGTSKFLKNYNIHIGDNLYTLQDIELKKNPVEESEYWTIIPKYYDIKALDIINETWVKVIYNNKSTGYILIDNLTSESLMPGIVEESRKVKIINKADYSMLLNEPSGLTLDDYKKILSNQSQDTNNVFKENYKAFYDAERKYNINGVFLTAIAIHESGWGKSNIAKDKHNLFGFGAYDASPYESAITFETYADGVDAVAEWLISNYLNDSGTVLKTGKVASGTYYNGANVAGVNVRYASDPEWSLKVFATMQKLYNEL